MKMRELIEVASDITNLEGIHYLMLYTLFDLAIKNESKYKIYPDIYINRLKVPQEIWEKIYGLWLLDYMLETPDAELMTNLTKAISYLILRSDSVTDWDRHILYLIRELNENNNAVAYARHLSKSSDLRDFEEIIDLLYDNKMYGNIWEFTIEKLYLLKDNEIIRILAKLLIEKKNDALTLFNFTWEEKQEKIIEEILIKSYSKELLILF